MCSTDRYAPTFFRSDAIAMYIVATVMLIPTNNISNRDVAVNNDHCKNIKQLYNEYLSSMQASITDPAHVASTCASGNQKCNGYVGILANVNTANSTALNDVCDQNDVVCTCESNRSNVSVQ